MHSMRFKSRLWESCSKTYTLAWVIHSFTTFDVCLGSLSCWNTQLHPRPNLLADDFRFPWRIWRYPHSSIFHLLSIEHQVKMAAKQPHSIILSAPYFTVGMVVRFWWVIPQILTYKHIAAHYSQTTQFLFHLTTEFSSRGVFYLSMWSAVNFSRALRCCVWSEGFFSCMAAHVDVKTLDSGHWHLFSNSF